MKGRPEAGGPKMGRRSPGPPASLPALPCRLFLPLAYGAQVAMIIIHRLEPRRDATGKATTLVQHQLGLGDKIPADAVWIDLFEPTRDEERAAEECADISLPTPEEM